MAPANRDELLFAIAKARVWVDDLAQDRAASFAEIAEREGKAREGAYSRTNAMLDHVSLGVTDINRSRRFYDAILRPLGLVRIVDFGEGRGSDYGAAAGSVGVEFTITHEICVRTPIPGAHVCFRAPDRAAVDAFHAAALASG